jgi:hypothetical protein
VDRVGFEPTTSAMPQLSPDYSLPPFKGEAVEREQLFKYAPLHFPRSIALWCTMIKRLIRFKFINLFYFVFWLER